MTETQINELEKLIADYSAKHGKGTGDEISGALMMSHDVAEQIKLFKRARGRKIIPTPVSTAIDAVKIVYLPLAGS